MKARRVIDASVVAATLPDEPHKAAARAMFASGDELHVPDLIYAEVGNVLWKKTLRGGLEPAEVPELLVDLLRLPLVVTPSSALLERAVSIALITRRTVYDCLYLALAVRLQTTMETADEKLVNALASGPLARYVRWIGG